MWKMAFKLILLILSASLLTGCFTRDIPPPAQISMDNAALADSTLADRKFIFITNNATSFATNWSRSKIVIIFNDDGTYRIVGFKTYGLNRTGNYIYQTDIENAAVATLVLQSNNSRLLSVHLQYDQSGGGLFNAELIENGNSMGILSGTFSPLENNEPYNIPLFSPMQDVYYK